MLKRSKRSTPRIFFATDVHGSEACFRKFVNAAKAYEASAIILGGDITGKQLVLIVTDNGGWRLGEGPGAERLDNPEELAAARKPLRSAGRSPIVVPGDAHGALRAAP